MHSKSGKVSTLKLLILVSNKKRLLVIMDENLRVKATEAIQEIYKEALFKKAIACIETSYPNTGEYVLRSIENDSIVVGYLSYYTEEGILTPYSEQLGLTEADIGEPCEYWEMVLAIDDDGSVYECQTGNNSPDKHPEWERISKE